MSEIAKSEKYIVCNLAKQLVINESLTKIFTSSDIDLISLHTHSLKMQFSVYCIYISRRAKLNSRKDIDQDHPSIRLNIFIDTLFRL